MLPKSWHGHWKGTLAIRPPLAGFPPTVAMELTIAPLDGGKVSWTLVYDGQPRDYELAPVAGAPDRFVLDEKNGITMDAHRDDDTLHCVFEVSQRLLVSRYTLAARTLRYEIRTYRRVEVTRPRGSTEIAVTSWALASVQSATLRRG